MPKDSPVVLAAQKLRGFVKALKKRPDVKVEVATLGKKTKKALIKAAEGPLGEVLGGELLEFYSLMNGAEIRWSFVEGAGSGAIEIPTFTGALFQGDDAHFMGFGSSKEARLLDGFGDANAWIVREAGSAGPGDLVFAAAAEGADGLSLGSSLADYLNKAMEHAGVPGWQAFTKGESYAESRESLKKFVAPPVKPAEIRPGVRIQTSSFFNQGRGEVLETVELEDGVLKPWRQTSACALQKFGSTPVCSLGSQ